MIENKKITHLIYAKRYPAKESDTLSTLLGIVTQEESLQEIKESWNRIYYSNLPLHYILSNGEIDKIIDIIPVDKQKLPFEYWPTNLSNELFNVLYQALRIEFVIEVEYYEYLSNKYLTILNFSFWQSRVQLLNFQRLIDTYELDFNRADFISKTVEESIENSIVIFHLLIDNFSPDGDIFYEVFDILESQNRKLNISKEHYRLNLNITLNPESNKTEIQQIRIRYQKQITALIEFYWSLTECPFSIIKVDTI